jgi:transglutaminase-like putative cysteine protease
VRDLRYGAPDFDRLDSFKASTMLREGGGYCVPKACAFVALCRASGVAARLAFADVSNHLASPRTLELMGGEVFAWHGYAEVLIGERWLKASPTFDSQLCARMGVAPLTFDGSSDAHLQACDAAGRTFMSYDRLHGTFHDVPARFLVDEMRRMYPKAHAAIRAGDVS